MGPVDELVHGRWGEAIPGPDVKPDSQRQCGTNPLLNNGFCEGLIFGRKGLLDFLIDKFSIQPENMHLDPGIHSPDHKIILDSQLKAMVERIGSIHVGTKVGVLNRENGRQKNGLEAARIE